MPTGQGHNREGEKVTGQFQKYSKRSVGLSEVILQMAALLLRSV